MLDKKDKPVGFFQDLKDKFRKRNTITSMMTNCSEQVGRGLSASYKISYLIAECGKPHTIGENLVIPAVKQIFFFSFQPFPSVRGGHSVSSFSTSFCLQHPSPLHQLPAYLPLLHLKIFSLVSLFSSFPVTPFLSFFFLHTLGLSS